MERGIIHPRKNYTYTWVYRAVLSLFDNYITVLYYYNYASKRKITTLNDTVMLVSRPYVDQVLTSVRL